VNNVKKASSDITTQITKEVDDQQKALKDGADSLKNEHKDSQRALHK